jgi:hypothetical protein
VQAVPALGVEAIAAQLDEAGARPDVGLDTEVVLQKIGGRNDFA